jgi:hypothetical protein
MLALSLLLSYSDICFAVMDDDGRSSYALAQPPSRMHEGDPPSRQPAATGRFNTVKRTSNSNCGV